MAVAMRGRVAQLAEEWRRRGFDLHIGIGIAQGPRDARPHRLRGALGLRGDRQRHEPRRAPLRQAGAGADPISQRVHAATEDILVAEPVGELSLRGFSRPTRAYDVTGLDAARARA